MTTPRLASATLASALIRLAEIAGGFAAVVRKGDAMSGQLLLQCLEKGQFSGLYERLLDPSGAYEWARCGPEDIENKEEVQGYLDRRLSRDPDLWIVELDVPDVTRFILQQGSRA
jgi:hypothetical protein